MADNYRLNIGSLRSDVNLTLHTHHAARIWMGRPKSDDKAGIIGLSGFCSIVNRMSRGAQQDGAVASGTASGDWTLSCVRGQIQSLTFVFNDGTVRTLPAPAEEVNGNQSSGQTSGSQQTIRGGLGWISDPYGIPCISGERKSNASQYIGSQVLITAAGAGAASLIKSDGNSTSVVATPGGAVSTTGISGGEAMGKIIGQGVNDISSWVNKLYGQAFAAVYVQPGAKVAIHLDQQLAIDYELKGRKVDYTSGVDDVSTTLD